MPENGSPYDACMTAEAPRRPSALDELTAQIELLTNEIDRLEGTLASVLTHGQPEQSRDLVSDPIVSSTSHVRGLVATLEVQVNRLGVVRNRLEV